MNNVNNLKIGEKVSGTVKSFQPYGAVSTYRGFICC